jgi:hypothetical protein
VPLPLPGQAPASGPPGTSYPGIPVAGVPGTGKRPGGEAGRDGLGTSLFAIGGQPPPEVRDTRNRVMLFVMVCAGLLVLAVIIIFAVATLMR